MDLLQHEQFLKSTLKQWMESIGTKMFYCCVDNKHNEVS